MNAVSKMLGIDFISLYFNIGKLSLAIFCPFNSNYKLYLLNKPSYLTSNASYSTIWCIIYI